MANSTEHPPGQGEGPASRRRIPVWVLIGGAVLGVFVLVRVLGSTFGGELTVIPTITPSTTDQSVVQMALDGVTVNNQWSPYIQEFNGVPMALVPAGCFMMGSGEYKYGYERPAHEVCFEEPFWIDVYEVTNGQYGSAECEYQSSSSDQPRICLTWFDALTHCESREARLPTEAEWEYTARGPDTLKYPWGNYFVADNVVFFANSERHTWPVGSKPRDVSWVGAFDLSGNVCEWVADWLQYYPSNSKRQVNPTGPRIGEERVVRGGSWDGLEGHARAAIRGGYYPDDESSRIGFRCARSYSP